MGQIKIVKLIDQNGVTFGIQQTNGEIHVLAKETALPADAATALNQFINPMLEMARGNVSGIVNVNKFGRSTNLDNGISTDIWDRANAVNDVDIWIAPTQARIHAIVSSSDNDSDSGGTNPQSDGARTIRIYGLTDWNTVEVNEDIVLDGTQSVDTVNSYVIIHRMKILTKGGNAAGPNVGLITATAAIDGTVTAQINAGNGQTLMAIYGIPSIQTLYVTSYYASLNAIGAGAARIDVGLLWNPEPDAELINFLIKHTLALQDSASSHFQHYFSSYNKLVGPGILKVQCVSTKDDQDVSAGFDLILVDN